jgi:AcrR family transcriptional regulator
MARSSTAAAISSAGIAKHDRVATKLRAAGAQRDTADARSGPGNDGAMLVGRVGRGRIGELQRARILAAMVELVRERGIGNVTVAHLVARSGVSRRTFYELFEDRDACFLAAFECSLARIAERVVPAYRDSGPTWRERVRGGLAALLRFMDEEPAVAALCVVDALGGGRMVLERRASAIAPLVEAVHEGCREATSTKAPRPLVAEGVVGSVFAVIHGRLLAPEPGPLVKLLNPLMAMIVLPYLGAAAADRELELRAPRARRPARREATVDPLRDLDMRLTYRTVRVLLAIAELGAQGAAPSSREVAEASEVVDQGQMSKLLWRLEHLGLIANGAPHPGRGAPNAWTLTAKGREVERAIRSQTPG